MKQKKLIAVVFTVIMIFSAVIYYQRYSLAQPSADALGGTILTGRVISPYGPVEKARVRIAGEDTYVLTDKEGRFLLKASHPRGTPLRVTAGKEGWFNNGQVTSRSRNMKDLFMNPVYLNDQSNYRFISPVTCAQCHVKLSRYWDQSKMAHTTSNPKVLHMYYGTDSFKREGIGPGFKLDNPRSNGNCATCHAPSVAASSPWSQDLSTALRSSTTEWDGISCDYCHKVRKVIPDRSKPSGMSAVLERQASTRGPSIMVFGPYDDVAVPPMAASFNPVFEEGKFCSVCHSHYNKIGEGEKWDSGKIYTPSEQKALQLQDKDSLPIQTTYQEWKHWQDQLPQDDPNKGKKCQDCHLSWRKDMLPYDNYVVDGMARRMWATHRSPKNIRPHHFEGGTETQLKTALAMEVEGDIQENRLVVRAYITNTNGGHWVPTGEPMRSVMLWLRASDSEGKPLKMTKGETLPEWTGIGKVEEGNYAGQSGAVFARVLQDDAGNLHVPFWKATRIASDTRIRPKKTLTLTFEFELGDPEDEPAVEAELIYRSVIRPLAEKKNWFDKDILITSSVW